MRQEEFLKSFQEALAGKVSEKVIQENIDYYRNYISNEMRNGKTEDAVMQSLGDPRLLAKTIEESNKYANGDESYVSDRGGWSFQGNRTGQNEQAQRTDMKKTFKVQGWLAAAIGIVVLLAVVSLVFSVISFLAPVILVAAVGLLVYRIITGDGGRSE